MTDLKHEQLRQIFERVIARPASERAMLLAHECAGDADLERRLAAMLAAAEDEHFLATPTGIKFGPQAAEHSAPIVEGPGTRIGPYKLLQQIGEGGFGVVFMAEQEKPVARRVALKIIKLGMDTREVVARFEQERQALALMEHPNIARVIDAGSTITGRPYFVMELVKGEPIAEYCDKNNLSIEERLELFAQVCAAVQHAHSKGIIHRDLKPSNILIATQDGRPSAKIIDFGIAKATSAKLTDKTVFTEHLQVIGTLQYMSPEQAEGSLDIDTRTDVYALGVVLYELLTGSTPFDARTLREAFYSEVQRIIREDDPPKPSTRLSQSADTLASIAAKRRVAPKRLGTLVRGELDWIVMKALEKDRARRYQTASGLAEDVRRYIAGEPVIAAPPSSVYRLKKFVRRHRFGVGAAGLVAAALIAGLVGTTWGMVQAQRERTVAAVQTEKAVQARIEADRERAATELARAQLQRVVDFQANMLRRVPPFEMGRDLALDLTARVKQAQAALDLPDEKRAEAVATLDALLGGISLTDAARRIIDTNMLAPSATAVAAEFKSEPVTQAALYQTIAKTYQSLGIYDKALEQAQHAFDLRRAELGPEARETLRSQVLVGVLHWALGHLDDSELVLNDVVPALRRVFGEEDQDALTGRVTQGVLLIGKHRNEEAQVLFQEVLAIQERTLGPEHEDLANTLGNLGAVAMNMEHPEQAAPLLERALAIRNKAFGASDILTLESQQHLAQMYEHQRRFDDAYRLRLDAIETLSRLKGANHPATIEAIAQLANTYKAQSRFAEAQVQARKALDLRRKLLGDAHPQTIDSMSTVAILCSNLGRYEESEKLFAEAVERSTQTFGADAPKTMDRVSNLAVAYWYQGKYSQVEPLFRRVLAFDEKRFGEKHQETAFALNNLAILLTKLGRLKEAEPLLERALVIDTASFGAEHEKTVAIQTSLAVLAYDKGEFVEAEKRLRALDALDRRMNGENNPLTLLVDDNWAKCLRKLDRDAEAETLLVETLKRRREVTSSTHPETLDTLTALADLYAETKRLDKARPLCEELIAARKSAADAADADPKALDAYASVLLQCPVTQLRDTARALACARKANELTSNEEAGFLSTLASALFESGDAAAAKEMMRSALAKLPPESPDRAPYEKRLAEFEAGREKR